MSFVHLPPDSLSHDIVGICMAHRSGFRYRWQASSARDHVSGSSLEACLVWSKVFHVPTYLNYGISKGCNILLHIAMHKLTCYP